VARQFHDSGVNPRIEDELKNGHFGGPNA